jgi:hypothetical protein
LREFRGKREIEKIGDREKMGKKEEKRKEN